MVRLTHISHRSQEFSKREFDIQDLVHTEFSDIHILQPFFNNLLKPRIYFPKKKKKNRVSCLPTRKAVKRAIKYLSIHYAQQWLHKRQRKITELSGLPLQM